MNNSGVVFKCSLISIWAEKYYNGYKKMKGADGNWTYGNRVFDLDFVKSVLDFYKKNNYISSSQLNALNRIIDKFHIEEWYAKNTDIKMIL